MRIRSVSIAVVLAVVLGGCGGTIAGTATGPTSSPASSTAGSNDPSYVEPPDGSGFSTQPMDQPLPLPTTNRDDGCGWLESTLPRMRSLGATRFEGTLSGCQFELNNGQGVQIHLIGPYNRITQDTALLRPVEIAGIKGRTYAFDGPPATFCSVELDIRTYASLRVDGYELAGDEAGDRDAHCELAKRAAEIIVTRYVPLAGGTPWPQTGQQPAGDLLARTDPCETVRFTDVIFGAISSGREDGRADHTALGPTCRYQSAYATATAQIVTATGGLAQLPKRAGARLHDSTFGTLPARTEQTADACLLSVQFGNGQVLQLEFKPNHERDYPITCLSAQMIMASAISSHIAGAS